MASGDAGVVGSALSEHRTAGRHVIVFLASWLALSLVAGALWSLAMSRGGIVSEAPPPA